MRSIRQLGSLGKDSMGWLCPSPDVGSGVLVLGMHCSGTSALARVVALLGLSQPADVSAQHWESGALTNFNERLLGELGGSWHTPPPLGHRWERHPRLLTSTRQARQLFRDVIGHTHVWTWKDPRIALTLPFWRRSLRFRPLIVAIHRNPLEICRSLETRDGFSKAKALALWERYNQALLANTQGLDVLLVSYDKLIEEPLATALSVSAFLHQHGLALRALPEAQIRAFIDPRLRHSRCSNDELNHDTDLTVRQRLLIHWLNSLTARPSSATGAAALSG